jgi:hypothetical protein
MKKEVGLWIDRRIAVIVTILHSGDGLISIQSSLEKNVLFSGILAQEGWMGNMHDRKFADYLTGYYDDVISCIPDADSIQIFGPGEARLQLEQRLKRVGLGGRIVGTETAEKMTEGQIEMRVWQHMLSLQS